MALKTTFNVFIGLMRGTPGKAAELFPVLSHDDLTVQLED